MSESLVELAKQELEDHGVEVEEPSRVHSREDMDVMDVIEGGGFGEGVSSASYDMVTDTVTLYTPMAKAGAVNNILSEDQYSNILSQLESGETPEELQKSVNDAFRNIESVTNLMEDIGADSSVNRTAEAVATGRAIYEALRNGLEAPVDEDTREELRDEARWQLQTSTEHELIHKEATDTFVDIDGRTEELLSNLKEVTAIEMDALYEGGSHQKKRLEKRFQNKEEQFPFNIDDLRRAAVIELDDGYEEKKQEVKEKIDHVEREMDRTSELFSETLERWRNVEAETKQDIFGDDRELKEAYIELQHSVHNLFEEDDKLTREDYRGFLEERDMYTPERVDRLMDAEEQVSGIEDAQKKQKNRFRDKKQELYDELEEYINEKADEMEEEIEDYLQPLMDRVEANSEVPVGSVGESFAHFWTMYRRGELDDEESRDQKKEGLQRNYPEGGERAAEVIEDLFQQYDEMNGSEQERVTYVMSQQSEYLEQEMESSFLDQVTDRIPASDYLPF